MTKPPAASPAPSPTAKSLGPAFRIMSSHFCDLAAVLEKVAAGLIAKLSGRLAGDIKTRFDKEMAQDGDAAKKRERTAGVRARLQRQVNAAGENANPVALGWLAELDALIALWTQIENLRSLCSLYDQLARGYGY